MESSDVGLILDSSVVIAGERRGHTVRQILEQFKNAYGETADRLVRGDHRGTDSRCPARRNGRRPARRQSFVDELIRDMPVHPVNIETARLAGRIEGDHAAQGVTIAFEDLLIAATALGFGVVTGNVRHFEQIPGLTVVKL